MKKALIIAGLITVISTQAFAQQTCDEKIKEIETQIAYAKDNNLTYRITGLEKALAKAKKNCSPETLKAAKQKKINNVKKEIEKETAELKAANVSGKKDKIQKRQKKLAEKKAELEKLNAELNAIK